MSENSNQVYLSMDGERRLDVRIEKVLKREFPLPEKVERAQDEAFAKIRAMQGQAQTGSTESGRIGSAAAAETLEDCRRETTGNAAGGRNVSGYSNEYQNLPEYAQETGKQRCRKGKGAFAKICAGFVAAAAAFSGVCIVNPAFGAQIPLIGHVFEELGSSLGFTGDYSKYATTLTEDEAAETASAGSADISTDNTGDGTDSAAADGSADSTGSSADGADSADSTGSAATQSSASEGTSAEALYSQTVDGTTITLSEFYYNDSALYISMVITSEEAFPDTALDQNEQPLLDLGVLTIQVDGSEALLTNYNFDGKFVDDNTYAGVLRYDLSEITNAVGEISDTFTASLNIPQVIGTKPDGAEPEMPEDLTAEYEAAMAENGLSTDEADYENFTEEQKELKRKLYTQMQSEYAERYPETNEYPNSYLDWWIDGPWSFTLEVTKNVSDSIVVEIGDVDENGLGLISVTKTPLEITVACNENVDYFPVILDADGNLMSYGGNGSVNTVAIGDSDVSKIDVYLCDYIEYMDELKGYWYSDDYEENAKTKTFKQLLDERALYHREITFD